LRAFLGDSGMTLSNEEKEMNMTKPDKPSHFENVTNTCEGSLPPRLEEHGRRSPKSGNKTTKAELILKRLRSKRGASLEELAKATGWQTHSVRGFLSGTVRKRLGLSVEVETSKSGIRRYRIAEDVSDIEPIGQKR
jgi:hypothetical protein